MRRTHRTARARKNFRPGFERCETRVVLSDADPLLSSLIKSKSLPADDAAEIDRIVTGSKIIQQAEEGLNSVLNNNIELSAKTLNELNTIIETKNTSANLNTSIISNSNDMMQLIKTTVGQIDIFLEKNQVPSDLRERLAAVRGSRFHLQCTHRTRAHHSEQRDPDLTTRTHKSQRFTPGPMCF